MTKHERALRLLVEHTLWEGPSGLEASCGAEDWKGKIADHDYNPDVMHAAFAQHQLDVLAQHGLLRDDPDED